MQNFWSGFEKEAMKQVSTVGIIDVDGRKLLMGVRRDNGRWTNPGGHLEKSESPIEGAIREVKEESGIRIDEDDLIHLKSKVITKPGGEKLKVHAFKVFFGSDRLPKPTVKHDPDEEVHEWKWIPMAGGLPKEVRENLHVPRGRNILLDNLNLSEPNETLRPPPGAKTAFWRGFEKKAGLLPAGIAHLLQNAGMKALSHSPAFGSQLARSFQEGFKGKAPGRIGQFFRGVAGGAGIPESSALTNHAYDLGTGFAKALRERGITHLTPKEQLILRHMSRGEFVKAMKRAPRAIQDKTRRSKLIEAFSDQSPLPLGALHESQSLDTLRGLEEVWKSPKNPLTSNIISRATDKLDKSRAHYPLATVVPATAEPLAHKTQLAGAATGATLLGVLDPVTAGINLGKMTLTNPAARAGLHKIPVAGQLVEKADSMLMKQPVVEGLKSGLAGTGISKSKQLLRTYGFNAATASAAGTMNNLGLAARKVK